MTLFPLHIAATRLFTLFASKRVKNTSSVTNILLALGQLMAEDEHGVSELMLKGYFRFFPPKS